MSPLFAVEHAYLRSVRGSLLGGDTSRRLRVWELRLSCGHRVQRDARYVPRSGTLANGWHPRSRDDVLPAPKRARCDHPAHLTRT